MWACADHADDHPVNDLQYRREQFGMHGAEVRNGIGNDSAHCRIGTLGRRNLPVRRRSALYRTRRHAQYPAKPRIRIWLQRARHSDWRWRTLSGFRPAAVSQLRRSGDGAKFGFRGDQRAAA